MCRVVKLVVKLGRTPASFKSFLQWEWPLMPRLLATLTWSLCISLSADALAQPAITYTVPLGVTIGKESDLEIVGTKLKGATGLWTSLGASASLTPDIKDNGQQDTQITYRLSVPAETPPGIAGLRVATGIGTSYLQLFVVDDLPIIKTTANHYSLPTAQEITLPVAIDGSSVAERSVYYKFAAKKGQRVSLEVIARRLASALDPVIRLLDGDGNEIAYSDDQPGLTGDCRLAHTFAQDGTYYIELRDIRYLGGATYRYHLRVGNFPLANVPYPLAAQKGKAAKVTLVTASAEVVPPLAVNILQNTSAQSVPLGAKLPGGQGSAMVSLIASDMPETIEAEPNDKPEQATALTLPQGVSGRFEKPGDRDYYQFTATKGQKFSFAGVTRQVGSPTDLFMRIYDSAGKKLAEAEDVGTGEGKIALTVPADGNYRLMVEDLHQRGGPEHVYRIAATVVEPGFTLVSDAVRVNPPKNGVFVFNVTAARVDFTEAISLSVEGAGQGLVLKDHIIPKGKNVTNLKVTIPAALDAGTYRDIKIVGSAKIGEKMVRAEARTLSAARKLNPLLAYLPLPLDGSIGLGVGPVFPDFFQLSLSPAQPVFAELVKSTTLTVNAKRLNKFVDPITLKVEGLPEGVTAKVVPIAKSKNSAAIVLTGPEKLAQKETKIKITAAGTHQNQPRQVVLDTTLKVVPPLQISLAPARPLEVGKKQKLKFVATRFGGEKGPITLTLKNLPQGVTAPADLKIAEGKNDLEIELTAAADAAPGKVENLLVTATTKVKDQPITVDSTPSALEVVAVAAKKK